MHADVPSAESCAVSCARLIFVQAVCIPVLAWNCRQPRGFAAFVHTFWTIMNSVHNQLVLSGCLQTEETTENMKPIKLVFVPLTQQ